MNNNNAVFNPVNKSISDDIKAELRAQGHYLTGKLEESFKEVIIDSPGGLTLSVEAADYLSSLEKETPAGQISLTEQDMENLTQWVIMRGMATYQFEARQIAYAIYTKWKHEGRPTPGSLQYSQTGKRTEAIKDVFHKNEPRYTSMIDNTVVSQLDNEFNQIKSGTI